jgi:hypothetical protein
MDQAIDSLIIMTRDMADAFDRDDLDECARLLSLRGELLTTLSAQYGATAGPTYPKALLTVMATVREQDRILGDRLEAALVETGRSLGDIKQKTRPVAGGSDSIYLNRRV